MLFCNGLINYKLRLVLIVIFFVGILGSNDVTAQQSPQWTQYVLNQYAINPAYAGLDRSLSITAGLRSQWSQFPGSPKTQMISGHIPMYLLSGSVGAMLINDELGSFNRTSASVSYNFVLDAPIGLISGGFRIGAQQVTINNEELITPGGNYFDNIIDHQDPRLQAANLSGVSPIWSLGLFYVRDLLEIGFSVDNVPGNSLEAGSSTFTERVVATFFGSYQYPISDFLSIEPNVLVKSDGSQTQLDIGLLGHYNQFIAGFSFRGYDANSIDAVGVIAGVRVTNNIKVSYSFDLGLSALRQFHDGTHEFLINYNLNKPIRTGELPRIIYNPRYN